MEEFIPELTLTLKHLLRLAFACALALPIGLDRERQERKSLGLRTFPLVAMASCGFMLIGQQIVAGDPSSAARILQGLITGVGFLGGGAIVKSGLNVHGTATAASIWSTACIGAAIAFGRYEIAVAVAVATFLCLNRLVPMKNAIAEIDGRPCDDELVDGELPDDGLQKPKS